MRLKVLLLFLVALAACDKSGERPAPGFTGQTEGEETSDTIVADTVGPDSLQTEDCPAGLSLKGGGMRGDRSNDNDMGRDDDMRNDDDEDEDEEDDQNDDSDDSESDEGGDPDDNEGDEGQEDDDIRRSDETNTKRSDDATPCGAAPFEESLIP